MQKVQLINAAVSNEPGLAVFRFREGLSDLSVCAHSLAYEIEGAISAEVKPITVDDLLLTNGIVPNLIKIDVKGAEMQVFRGAEKTQKLNPALLAAIHPGSMAEMGDDPEELIQWMKRAGFGASRLNGSLVSRPGFVEITFKLVENSSEHACVA